MTVSNTNPAKTVTDRCLYDVDIERRFGGISRLYGRQALQQFTQARICIIGIGGVGSWVVEAFARSGIGAMALIDMDHVSESNVHRQLHAMSSTLGMAKIKAMAARIEDINPHCSLELVDDFVTAENTRELLAEGYDYVIDCADNFRVKAAIIACCKRNKVRAITIGGAGGRIDPGAIKVTDLARSEHDPLLSQVRKRLRRHHGFSRNLSRRFDVPCVFSNEQARYSIGDGSISPDKSKIDRGVGLNCGGALGSATHVTAAFGFAAVAHVLNRLSAGAES